MNNERNKLMMLRNGALIDPLYFTSLDVHFHTVAHSLACMNRYGGHTVEPISVAEHCCRVHDWLEANGHNKLTCVMGLWHDAGESFLVDIPSPIKRRMDHYARHSHNAQNTCRMELLCSLPTYMLDLHCDNAAVKSADEKACLYEAIVGWPETDILDPIWIERFGQPNEHDAATLTPHPWNWREAKAQFLARLARYVDVG
jgi:hypothetical protein